MKRALTIQLDTELFEEIQKLANSNHISLAGEIRMLLVSALSQSKTKTCTDIFTNEKT